MPHIVVKIYEGRTDADKARLAEALAEAMMSAIGSRDGAISVSVEDVAPADWPEQVYRPDILDKPDTLFRKPDYNPFG